MRTYGKLWTAAVAVCLATLVLAALILPQSFRLTALSDVVQCLLLFSGVMSLIPHAARSHGRLRLFWTLMATGIGLWFSYQLFWTYYEVWLRADVPDLCAADIILFLHIVPLMAALALRPHAPQDEYAARLRRLDFALMMVWWAYLYVLIVIPWQYVIANVTAYGANLNSLYLIEKIAFLSALALAWVNSKDGWKTLYASLFGASITYAASSYIANWALSRHSYYSGSLYDIPLAISMAWITMIGLWARQREPQAGVPSTSTSHGVWLARVGMIAAFSLPLFAAWALLDTTIPGPVRSFRLVLTLAMALLMGMMVFVRQRLLDRELHILLNHSRESLANLKRLQAQIMEAEKLASIGQLVGGVTHELNNPIAAMLGYSDLLLTTPLNPEQGELAGRIGQHVRRTKSLVASLLSFARQGPAAMASVDLKILLRTAITLSQPQAQALRIEVCSELSPEPLIIQGDSNQLLQVCVQIINDALYAVGQHRSGNLTISAEKKDGLAIIGISEASFAAQSAGNREEKEDQTLSGLGLSACQGILRQHHGRILWTQDRNTGTNIRVEIPVIPPAPEKSAVAGVPVMWQPQAFSSLAAGSVNVPASRTPHKRWYSRSPQNVLKRRHPLDTRSRKLNPQPRIQRNQIHLAAQPAQQLGHFPRVLGIVVHAAEQHVLERDPLPRTQRKIPRRRHQHLDIPLLVQRHKPRPQRVIRRIQRNRQLRADRFPAKVTDARHNPRCRNSHPPLGNANALHQQTRCFNKIVIVEKRLAHAHEDQIDAIIRRRNALILDHRANLPHNLTRSKIALHPQQRSQAELAIDRAPHLTGNTNRRSTGFASLWRRVEQAFQACVRISNLELGFSPQGTYAGTLSFHSGF